MPWSDCTDAQADLFLHGAAQIIFVSFALETGLYKNYLSEWINW